ncbi:hypothetical protein NKH37_11240 [Mesorhizobium sp. M1217]|uniref:hypothetical protein n=1 Tax=Mesorhizobium sp. M1217 TaxID=2957070 RepID=UPI00333B9D6F
MDIDQIERRKVVIPLNTVVVDRIDAAAKAAGEERVTWLRQAIVAALNRQSAISKDDNKGPST